MTKVGRLRSPDQLLEFNIYKLFFSSSKNCLSAQYDQVQFTNNHHIFQQKYLESGVQIVVHLQIFDSPRVAGQVDPSPNKALNDRRACQAMILPFHIHAPYIYYSIFFFMVSFCIVNRGASRFPTQDWIYAAGFWARCSFVFFLSKHGIFMLVCSIISLSCK